MHRVQRGDGDSGGMGGPWWQSSVNLGDNSRGATAWKTVAVASWLKTDAASLEQGELVCTKVSSGEWRRADGGVSGDVQMAGGRRSAVSSKMVASLGVDGEQHHHWRSM